MRALALAASASLVFFSVEPVYAGSHELPIVDVDYNCLHFKDNTSYSQEAKISMSRTCIHSDQEAYNSLKAGEWEQLSDNSQTQCLKTSKTAGYYYTMMLECTQVMEADDLNKEETQRRLQIQNNEQKFKP